MLPNNKQSLHINKDKDKENDNKTNKTKDIPNTNHSHEKCKSQQMLDKTNSEHNKHKTNTVLVMSRIRDRQTQETTNPRQANTAHDKPQTKLAYELTNDTQQTLVISYVMFVICLLCLGFVVSSVCLCRVCCK